MTSTLCSAGTMYIRGEVIHSLSGTRISSLSVSASSQGQSQAASATSEAVHVDNLVLRSVLGTRRIWQALAQATGARAHPPGAARPARAPEAARQTQAPAGSVQRAQRGGVLRRCRQHACLPQARHPLQADRWQR